MKKKTLTKTQSHSISNSAHSSHILIGPLNVNRSKSLVSIPWRTGTIILKNILTRRNKFRKVVVEGVNKSCYMSGRKMSLLVAKMKFCTPLANSAFFLVEEPNLIFLFLKY